MPATKAFGEPEVVRVTQIRSQIGQPPKVRGTLRALGLRGISKSNELPLRPEISGMLRRVRHLVRVDPISSDSPEIETTGISGRRGMTVEADDDGVFISFPTRMTQRQADDEIHRAVPENAAGTTFALRWDDGEGVLREYEASPPSRPWLSYGNSERFGLLRVDLDDGLTIGIEPSLECPDDPVDIYIHCGMDAVDQALAFVDKLGGRSEVGKAVRGQLKQDGVKA